MGNSKGPFTVAPLPFPWFVRMTTHNHQGKYVVEDSRNLAKKSHAARQVGRLCTDLAGV